MAAISLRNILTIAFLARTFAALQNTKRQNQDLPDLATATADDGDDVSSSTSTLALATAPPTTEVITTVVAATATGPTDTETAITYVVTYSISATAYLTSAEYSLSTLVTTGRLTVLTTTRPATVYTITGQTLIDFTSVVTSTPGVGPTSPQSSTSVSSTSSTGEGITDEQDGGLSTAAVAAIAVCITLGAIGCAAFGFFLIRRRRRSRAVPMSSGLEKDGIPVSELPDDYRPHEAGSTALLELEVPPCELEDGRKVHERPPAKLEVGESTPDRRRSVS